MTFWGDRRGISRSRRDGVGGRGGDPWPAGVTCGISRGSWRARVGRIALGIALPLLAGGGGACVHESPRDGLRAYTAALRARDEAAVRARSDARSRGLWATHRVLEDDWDALAAGLDREAVQVEERARLHLDGGRVVELVREDGRWQVAGGGLRVARADTPRAALVTFMVAYDAGRLDVLRTLIPRRFSSIYASDERLTEHLSVMASRIEAARPALSVDRPSIEGDSARIPYGRGRAVELVLEDGSWRVLDLE